MGEYLNQTAMAMTRIRPKDKNMRKKREYLILAERSLNAMHSAIDSFNRVYDKYKIETCLILMTNAWELLGKAILVKKKQTIIKDKLGNTFPAEVIVNKLKNLSLLA